MQSYTVMLSYFNDKRSFVNKTYRNIQANSIIDAGNIAMDKWGHDSAVVNCVWLNWKK
jgi:hypothetical protein